MTPALPKLGALAVVLREDHVLLVQRGKPPDAGLWGFPGGHVELGETALEAAIRELAEETGVVARAQGYLTNVDVIARAGESVAYHYLLAAVQCDYVRGTPCAADDARNAAWFPIAEVLEGRLPCSERVPAVLRCALHRATGVTLP